MEGKMESGSTPAIRVLEALRRHLYDHDHPDAAISGKMLSSREVCTSLTDLQETVRAAAHKLNAAQVISSSVELLVRACASNDRDIRFSASENLKKLIKALMNTHLSRLQQDLFHELKKNGSVRSLCASLDCFSALFPLTRPAKCSGYSNSLLPVLVRLTGRPEEALHEGLQEGMARMLPTMVPFLNTANLRFLMMGLIQRLPKASATYRRMASSTLHILISHSRSSHLHAEWLISKLLDMGCTTRASSELVQGVLLTLQLLFSSLTEISPPLRMLQQAYTFILSCLLYRDANTAVDSLEALHQLLVSSPAELAAWLVSVSQTFYLASDFWADGADLDAVSTHSQLSEGGLETPFDEYFDSEQEVTLAFASGGKSMTTGYSKVIAMATPVEPETPPSPSPTLAISENSCLAVKDGPQQPLANMVEYLCESVLVTARVSGQSVALACLTASIDLHPPVLPSLEVVEQFTGETDPKLKSRAVKLLGTVIASQLRSVRGDFSLAPAILPSACELLSAVLEDSTAMVLKAVCEALQVCLPSLSTSTDPQRACAIIHRLLPLRMSSYWLTKVELLQTLFCLDLTALAMVEELLPETVLFDVVLMMLRDSDHRVRSAASEALVSLAPHLQLRVDPMLAHAQFEATNSFEHLTVINVQLSLAGIGNTHTKATPKNPMCLKHILWFLLQNISSSLDATLQRGCLEALHLLSLHYPPSTLPDEWGSAHSSSTALSIVQPLLTSSKIAWNVQGHCELLELASSLILASALSNLHSTAQTGQSWCALSEPSLASHAHSLLSHVTRLLAIFVHIIEQREPEAREGKKLQMPGVPRRHSSPTDTSPLTSPSGKSKTPLLDTLQKPSLVPKDGLGHFSHLAQYLKVFDTCKAAYTNYQVSLAAVGEDKFSKLLQITHCALSALFEVALADDIGRHVEELLTYLNLTVKVDYSGSLLCVQQLLNALFGMNTAAQHAYLYSPYLSSLPFDISMPISPTMSTSLTQTTVTHPLSMMSAWLQAPPPSTLLTPHNSPPEQKKKMGLFPSRRTLMAKPINPVSSVKDYIRFFEPLVVHSIRQFSYTSSILLQQRVLFLLVQLLQLKVHYKLLDCNHSFLESALKLEELMESGVVRGGERLVPHLFQFLVLLANDQSQLVTVPQVIQKCDGVMASGHNVTTFAIPALQPLVLNLFVHAMRETADLETQREVVLNMLLRLVEHSRVVVLLTSVLECYSRDRQKWRLVSSQIYAALLPHIGRVHLVLDSREAMVSLYQLFTAMDPHTINITALFTALLKQVSLSCLAELRNWLGVVCTVLELMVTIFPDATLMAEISSLEFHVPELKCPLATVSGEAYHRNDGANQLALFLRGALYLSSSTLAQLMVQRAHEEDSRFLPQLTANILLLVQTLIQGPYRSLRAAFAALPVHTSLTETFLLLASSYPLLTLHYLTLMLHTSSANLEWISRLLSPSLPSSPNHNLLLHCTLLLVCEHCSTRPELLSVASHSPNLILHSHTPAVRRLLSSAVRDKELMSSILQLLVNLDLSQPSSGLRALDICQHMPCVESLQFLCSHLLSHPIAGVRATTDRVACEILQGLDYIVEGNVIADLMERVSPLASKYPKLFEQLSSISQDSEGGEMEEMVASEGRTIAVVHPITEAWFIEQVRVLCSRPCAMSGEVCAGVLGRMAVRGLDVRSVMKDREFDRVLLESCLVYGVRRSLLRDAARSSEETSQLAPSESVHSSYMHPLFQVSFDCFLHWLKDSPRDTSLLRPLLWILVAQPHLNGRISLDNDVAVAMATLVEHALLEASKSMVSLDLQSTFDCCAMILRTSKVIAVIDDKWIRAVVGYVSSVAHDVYPDFTPQPGSDDPASMLSSLFTFLHQPSHQLPLLTLRPSLEAVVLSLCRLPSLHPQLITPPLLMPSHGEEKVTDRMLDQALMESEVLQQYMQRCNPIGWIGRTEFEEHWMQLLGVVNQPSPPEGMPPEECHAHTLNVCAGVEAVTSLLLSTVLRPHPGDPTTSVPMHVHRNSDVLFLGSKPGRKLAHLRRQIELRLMLQCGRRDNLYSRYQLPIHLTFSPHYPPLFARNLERSLGDSDLGPGQMSLDSLWPIMLKSPERAHSAHTVAKGIEIDVRSCILSLIDLYSHWLSHPIHTILLHRVLRSIFMLSDLFALSGQFNWMLKTLLRLHDTHPPEDSIALAYTMAGIAKAAAVLKLSVSEAERLAKMVERCLSLDSVAIAVQNTCLRGVLYLAEDPGSTVIPLIGATMGKYITAHLTDFPRYTESHLLLVWSVAVNMVTMYSQHLRDPSFTTHLLDSALPILLHPHTPTSLFHSLTLGFEHLVINFSTSTEERAKLARTAASQLLKVEQGKSLACLALLLTCIYTGDEVDVLSGVAGSESGNTESAFLAREHVSNLFERLRHGPLVDIDFLVDILPQLIVDLLPSIEVLQMVVTEFVSPHQSRPKLAGQVMAETLNLLQHRGEESLVTEWILLSLESFVQQEPESKAVWSITCLLMSSSTDPIMKAMCSIVTCQSERPLEEANSLLCTAALAFFSQQCVEQVQRERFLEKFQKSTYPSLQQVVHACLHG